MSESENRSPSPLAGILGFLAAAILLVQTLVLGGLGVLIYRSIPDLSETLSDFVDDQIDAGEESPVFDVNEPLLRARKVLLFHDVNSRTAKDVSARLLYLSQVDPGSPIDLYISTQGGWEDNAFAIIDTMRTIAAPVNTWAVGGCYSAGVLILTAGTGRRYATEDSVLMIHANLERPEGDAYSYPPLAQQRYERVYKETAALPPAWYPMTTDEQYYLAPAEALKMKLIDEIVPVWKAPAERR
jgi:ATP-dependent Clp endopeptidase proteolytic subunit ClpP